MVFGLGLLEKEVYFSIKSAYWPQFENLSPPNPPILLKKSRQKCRFFLQKIFQLLKKNKNQVRSVPSVTRVLDR